MLYRKQAVLAAHPARRQRDGGYLLLSILLMMAFMIIAATVAAPRMVQQIKRDREEEMIHRGTEYARAIKKFYKKNGRYPTNLDDLDKGQVKYLRKRYKDPLTKNGQWTMLHYGDIQNLMMNSGAPGTPAGAMNNNGQLQPGQSMFGFNSNSTTGNQNSNIVYPSNSTSGIDPFNSGQSSNNTGGGGFFGTGVAGGNGAGFGAGGATGQNSAANASQPGNPLGGQQLGGGAVVGVASLSKDPTIRLYNKKKKYNEWQFIYDPSQDNANVLLRGPYQPMTYGGAQVGTPAGQMNGQQPGGFGQSSTFSQPGAFGQQPGNGQQQPSSGFGQQQQQPQPPGGNFPPDQ
jgi:type II secretory pathway pseudopilin PulG